MNQRTVLVTAKNVDEAAIGYLEAHGCTVRHHASAPAGPEPAVLADLLEEADAWVLGSTPVGAALLAAHPGLLVLARRGVGYEAIDVGAARAAGRVVTIASGGNGPSVADHAIGLMLAVMKRLVLHTTAMRADDWSFGPALELHGKTVGIVGLGRVGRLVARRLGGFEATVLATEIAPDVQVAAALGVRLVGLDTLLADSDVVTLHAPLTRETAEMIGPAALARMKPGAVLINTARGGLVDEAAVLAALESGRLAGAGFDVFMAEKDATAHAAALALVRHPHVVATPHTAAATVEGLRRANAITVRTVVGVLDGAAVDPDCIVVDGR